LGTQAQYAQWYQHRWAENRAALERKHSLELEGVRRKLKYASEQWQKCRLSEQRKVEELERAHEEELEASNAKRKRLSSADPLGDFFSEENSETEKQRLQILEEELKAEQLSQRKIAGDWRAELVIRDDATNRRQSELDERERDLENKIAEIQSKENELARLDNAAIDNDIKEAELSVRSVRLDRERAEYEEKMKTKDVTLCDKAASLQVREEELSFLFPAHEACAQLMEDYEAVDGAVKYLTKQKDTLNGEIARMVKKHAALAQSFQRLQAEVMAPPVEP
jgi:hypothetical protein